MILHFRRRDSVVQPNGTARPRANSGQGRHHATNCTRTYCFSLRPHVRHLHRALSSKPSHPPLAANFRRRSICFRSFPQYPRKIPIAFWTLSTACLLIRINSSQCSAIYPLRTWRSRIRSKTASGWWSLCASRTSACCIAVPTSNPLDIGTELRCTLPHEAFRQLLVLAPTLPGQRPRSTRCITLGSRLGRGQG